MPPKPRRDRYRSDSVRVDHASGRSAQTRNCSAFTLEGYGSPGLERTSALPTQNGPAEHDWLTGVLLIVWSVLGNPVEEIAVVDARSIILGWAFGVLSGALLSARQWAPTLTSYRRSVIGKRCSPTPRLVAMVDPSP